MATNHGEGETNVNCERCEAVADPARHVDRHYPGTVFFGMAFLAGVEVARKKRKRAEVVPLAVAPAIARYFERNHAAKSFVIEPREKKGNAVIAGSDAATKLAHELADFAADLGEAQDAGLVAEILGNLPVWAAVENAPLVRICGVVTRAAAMRANMEAKS